MEIQVPSTFANTWIYLSNSDYKKTAQSYIPGCTKLLCYDGCLPYLCFSFKDKNEDSHHTVRKDINSIFIFLGLEEPGLILSHLLHLLQVGKGQHSSVSTAKTAEH